MIRKPQIFVTAFALEELATTRFVTSISGDLAVHAHAYRLIRA